MSTQIKNNLFRFVTLRNPQLIDDKKKPVGFIYHPNENASQFFTAINGVNEEDKKAALLAEADNFAALKTKREAKNINETLYEFSTWLMLNKNHLTFVEIKEKALGIETLDSDQELLIWENLIYQTIAKKSVYVREALIQMLIANKFLLAFNKFVQGTTGDITFTDDQEKEFIRRAHANVVISKALFSGESKSKPVAKRLSSSQQKFIENAVDVNFAQTRVKEYELLLEALKKVELSYNKATQKSYQEELDKHNEDVAKLIEEATPVIIEETDENGNVIKIETYTDLNLPKFSFTKVSGLTESYLTDKISKSALNTFTILGLEAYDEFSEAYKALNEVIRKENLTISVKSPKPTKKVAIGGAILRAGEPVNFAFDYNIPNLMEITEDSLMIPFMMLLNGLEAADIASANYTITFENNTSVNESGFLTSANPVMLKLFPNGVVFPTDTQTYTLTGTLTLNTGEEISFEQLVDLKQRSNMGDFETVESNETVETTKQVFGVTNLGIADFRRVEQEVCCYVPGEVSHIENVMAREYKERSTRSLTSSEITTERTDEVERENLTDTTSTERNEMQSEVASLLNEDESQAYEANANMSYNGKVSFNAGAYFNAGSSSSSSNSNSLAQTYAQEVTERAMERIVQKTQTKRTSRILKEFEENNKHGFDNTKGAEHVTGVYRWVDKIYKNTLINYGKRLMYEFAIPEPSKFFKEAIWKQLDNNEQLESGVIKPEAPVHPSTIGITSAADIFENNYQDKAGKYGAEVNAAPQEFLSVSDAFSATGNEYITQHYHPGASNFKMEIPEGYEVTSAKVKLGFTFVPVKKEYTYGAVTVGNEYLNIINKGNDRVGATFDFLSNPIKKELGVAFHGCDVGGVSIGVIANCRRTSEIFAQWQNETYKAIMDAYYERLQEYNDAQNQDVIPTSDKEKLKFNPLYNRSLEKKELKRIAIELLTEQRGGVVSQNNYNQMAANGVYKVNKTAEFQNHASTVKFFEQAFDWDIMAYIFYPYFYAGKDDWKDLFQMQDAADPLFQAFLQSGMARTVVPVRPGFEDAVNWYMETGEIWNGEGLTIDQDDDMYVSVAEEMQTVEGVVEGTWETRLPTALTVLQAGSIGLDVEGLPCDKDCDHDLFDSDGNPIKQTDTLIGGTQEEVRHVENIDIVNGNLQLNTDDEPRQTVAQISIQALKNAIDSIA